MYQIYPRSFADANGDGIGDLKGITEKVPYLKELGIDAVWLSPFYPSALKDGGYDVADYRDVDPKIGTLEDFDVMMEAFNKVDIKVMVDIVPNHSSDDHVWFQEALKAPIGSAARDKFIFRDGLGEKKDQPPSDWDCLFGGSAWEPVGDGQWYLHLFDTSQPDFNWENREVRDDFIKTLRFWADKGVKGFRIDVAHGLTKDMSLPLPNQKEMKQKWDEKMENGAGSNIHRLWDRDEVHEIYREWRKVFDEYNPPLTAVAEAWVASDRKHLYASSDGLGQSFSFDMLMCNYDCKEFKDTIAQSLKDSQATDGSTTWVFSNHDVVRHATRYGIPDAVQKGGLSFASFCKEYLKSGGTKPKCNFEQGLQRARAATLMMLALPGSAYLYQGEELGLPEVVEIPDEQRQDPTFFRTKKDEIGRDGCRVPLPWTKEGTNFGFGSGKPAHLPQPDWMGEYSVEALDKAQSSTLNLYRKALNLRKKIQSAEELEWVDSGAEVLHFKRPGGWEVVMNFGEHAVDVPKGELLVASEELKGGKIGQDVAVWVKTA